MRSLATRAGDTVAFERIGLTKKRGKRILELSGRFSDD